MSLNFRHITGTLNDGGGNAITGYVEFVPSQSVYASGVPVASIDTAVTAQINAGTLTSVELLNTDNTGLTYLSLTGFFYWTASIYITGQSTPYLTFSFFLPTSGSSADLLSLANTGAGTVGGGTLAEYLAPAVVTLTDAASVSLNAQAGNDFRLLLTSTVGASRSLANPSNPADGEDITIALTQPASGGPCSVSWGTAYDFGSGGTPTLSTAANAIDLLAFKYLASAAKWICLGYRLGN
jgi:hypothetical protein